MVERLRRWSSGASQALRAALGDLARRDVLDLVPRLTVLLVILFGGGFWDLPMLARVLLIAALLYRPLHRSALFWLATAVFLVLFYRHHWFSIDNHKFLFVYWCLALAVVFAVGGGEERQRGVLARNAKLLIGLCMAFATLWKIISPDYLDGTFFRHALLSDSRFTSVTTSLGGLEPAADYHNRAMTRALREGAGGASHVEEVVLADTPEIRLMADLLTWWTIGIEGLLALAFLLPGRWGPSLAWRHGLLLFFAVTTYAIATVIGFGWLLVVMALGHLGERHPRLRLAYLAVLMLLLTYSGAWIDRFLPG